LNQRGTSGATPLSFGDSAEKWTLMAEDLERKLKPLRPGHLF